MTDTEIIQSHLDGIVGQIKARWLLRKKKTKEQWENYKRLIRVPGQRDKRFFVVMPMSGFGCPNGLKKGVFSPITDLDFNAIMDLDYRIRFFSLEFISKEDYKRAMKCLVARIHPDDPANDKKDWILID